MAFDLGPADLADGDLREAEAGGLLLVVARSGDRYVAFEIWCTHDYPASVTADGRVLVEIPILPA